MNRNSATLHHGEPVPSLPGLELYTYQAAGVQVLLRDVAAGRRGALLADPPGLGKTAQAAGLIASNLFQRTCVVCPSSLRNMWRQSLENWTGARVSVWDGKKRPRPEAGDKPAVIVLSVDSADAMHDDARAWLAGGLLIVDEAHTCGSRTAKRTAAVLGIGGKKPGIAAAARFLLLLTGTPLTSRPAQVFPLLASLDADIARWGAMWYERRYCAGFYRDLQVRGYTRRIWDATGASNIDELAERLKRFVIRRKKADVLSDLPTLRHIPISFSAPEAVREEIEALAEAMMIKPAALRAALNCGSLPPADVGDRAALTLARKAAAVARVPILADWLIDLLEDEEPTLIWTIFHDSADAWQKRLREASIPARVLDGRLEASERAQAVADFQAGNGPRVLICGIQAMGTGHTLTRAARCVFADVSWVPGDNEQARDRIHRIGQARPVEVWLPTLEGSVDELVARVLARKKDIIARVLSD